MLGERKGGDTMAATQMSREEARSLYDRTLREMYPDDQRIQARIEQVEREEAAHRPQR
jgi:hypothetical protein